MKDQRDILDFLESEIDVGIQMDQSHLLEPAFPPGIIGFVMVFNQKDVRRICLPHILFQFVLDLYHGFGLIGYDYVQTCCEEGAQPTFYAHFLLTHNSLFPILLQGKISSCRIMLKVIGFLKTNILNNS